jgi:hypothetical protein
LLLATPRGKVSDRPSASSRVALLGAAVWAQLPGPRGPSVRHGLLLGRGKHRLAARRSATRRATLTLARLAVAWLATNRATAVVRRVARATPRMRVTPWQGAVVPRQAVVRTVAALRPGGSAMAAATPEARPVPAPVLQRSMPPVRRVPRGMEAGAHGPPGCQLLAAGGITRPWFAERLPSATSTPTPGASLLLQTPARLSPPAVPWSPEPTCVPHLLVSASTPAERCAAAPRQTSPRPAPRTRCQAAARVPPSFQTGGHRAPCRPEPSVAV